MTLEDLGWNARWAERLAALGDANLCPGRVVWQGNGQYRVVDATGEHAAVLRGRLRIENAPVPVVGDWVALERAGEVWAIAHLLERDTAIVRAAAGTRTEPQAIAANIATVLLLTDPHDFSPRRLERYSLAIQGADLAVVINKADLVEDRGPLWREVERTLPGVPVLFVSALHGDGVDELTPLLTPGATLACVGSSGVGKSTLINRLLGTQRQQTAAVRAHDQRGQHTTTHRELLFLPSGAMVIDTPGLRELTPWFADGTVEFADVAALAEHCRFRDCTHGDEPGCAVRAAVADGTMDAGRVANLAKLQREAAFQDSRADPLVARARRQRDRSLGKLVRDIEKWHPKRR